MVVNSKIPARETIVLIDDVVTTGAHLRASAFTLMEAGVRCNEAICVARSQRCANLYRSFGIKEMVI